MRLFIGIATPPDDKILALLNELARAAQSHAGLQVVHPDNLHVTLKFLGEGNPERVPAIVSAMEVALAGEQSFDLQLGGAGFFANVLWLQACAPNLARMAERLDEALSAIGFESERRIYRPHVTLARLKPTSLFDVQDWLDRHAQRRPLLLPIGSVQLYQSVPVAGRVSYKPLHTLRLPAFPIGS